MKAVGRINLLGVLVSNTNLDLACEKIKEMILKKESCYICVAPVSTLVDCQRIKEYKTVINNACMVTPDGMPVVWLARLKGFPQVSRTYGPDLMRKMCEDGQKLELRHFFYGSSQDTLDKLQNHLRNKYPDINIVGSYSPSFKETVTKESKEIIHMINASHADILWVGLGSPKQDFWMVNHRSVLNPPIMVGIGAAFDFLSGVKPQAPRWVQAVGLEWLFRLCSEPRRLWKRYLIGNSLFIYYILRDFVRLSK